MRAIFERELAAYFHTPIGYVFIAIFLVVMNFVFYVNNIMTGSSDISALFPVILALCIVLLPLLTMRLFADEFKLRTAVLLFTASDSFWNVVAGKFFAAFAIYGMAIGLTLSWTLLAVLYSTPDTGAIMGYYIAILFAGAALISMGIFVSAMTENQLAAAVISSAIYLGMYLLELSKTGVKSEIYIRIVNWISIYSHFNYFSWGIFSFADIVFYLSFSGVFLFLTTKVLELRQLS